jgi:hypothetical protein
LEEKGKGMERKWEKSMIHVSKDGNGINICTTNIHIHAVYNIYSNIRDIYDIYVVYALYQYHTVPTLCLPLNSISHAKSFNFHSYPPDFKLELPCG